MHDKRPIICFFPIVFPPNAFYHCRNSFFFDSKDRDARDGRNRTASLLLAQLHVAAAAHQRRVTACFLRKAAIQNP
jgi:hypothetical protein